MGWDTTRPVPWLRFAKEGVVFGIGMMAVLFLIAGERDPSSFIGIWMGAVMYVFVAAVMAKFGYLRKTFAQLRSEAAAAPPRRVGPNVPSARPRPQPTKRTSTGPTNRPRKGRR